MSMCPVCNNPIDSQAPVCPHCGFKLLGSTQRFEPVSFGDDALPVAAAPQAAAALHVVRGPQTGVTYQLGDQALTIGRSPQCDLFLNEMTVSSTLRSSLRTAATSSVTPTRSTAYG